MRRAWHLVPDCFRTCILAGQASDRLLKSTLTDIELFQAFRQAGVDEPTAKAAVASINQQIDSRYALHAAQLFTKADGLQLEAKLAELKADLIKWCMGAVFASTALFAAVAKLLH